ncbi:Hypothetical predicted protein [Mytilus galloprovincialis]|uniref:Reverse transcriptase domain-containing protein n=1 Tax=Mytilus galloprovincialis TaxID=29158 RepID=A0A8B6EFQ9_MYTGA|nr:Hypothetical predicted protein [Mytilus galloprovincialis]
MDHFDKNKILTDAQHGFHKRRSCESQLIITINDTSSKLKSSSQVDIILLDLAKAFDKVQRTSTPPTQAGILWRQPQNQQMDSLLST